MSQDKIAFEKFFPRPLVFADKAHELEMISKWNDAKINWETALEAATTEANKRIAELESEVARKDSLLRTVENVADELKASNNDLREALKLTLGVITGETLSKSFLTKALEKSKAALSATPAESLQAFENEVIEKCAKVCDHVNQQYSDIFKDTKDRFNDGASYGADDCAECLRTLKEVK